MPISSSQNPVKITTQGVSSASSLAPSEWQAVQIKQPTSLLRFVREQGLSGDRDMVNQIASRNGFDGLMTKLEPGQTVFIPTASSSTPAHSSAPATSVPPASQDAPLQDAMVTGEAGKPSRTRVGQAGQSDQSKSSTGVSTSSALGRSPSVAAKRLAGAPRLPETTVIRDDQRPRLTDLVASLEAVLSPNNPTPKQIFTALQQAMREYDNADVASLYHDRTGSTLATALSETLSGRELQHASAYVLNESGKLEAADLIYFSAQGWDDRFSTNLGLGLGLGTANASLKSAIHQVTPDNRAQINEQLKERYQLEGEDPLSALIAAEFSLATERWLLAVPHLPRDDNGQISTAYKMAFDISELSDEAMLRPLEGLNAVQYAMVDQAFAALYERGMIPEAVGNTLAAHAKESLNEAELNAFSILRTGLQSGTSESVIAASRYVALRLEAQFGFNDNEEEISRLLNTFVGDGGRLPTFNDIASRTTGDLKARILNTLDGDSLETARALTSGHITATSPSVLAARIVAIDDVEEMVTLLGSISSDSLAAMRTSGKGDTLRQHVIDVAGMWLDDESSKIPSRALALYYRGAEPSAELAGLYTLQDGDWQLSAAAQVLYASFEPDGWIFGATDETGIFNALQNASPLERQLLPQQYHDLEKAFRPDAPLELEQRLYEELSASDFDKSIRLMRPTQFTTLASSEATADALVADIRNELDRSGLDWLTSAFDMERGAVNEHMQNFATTLLMIRSQTEGNPNSPLTAEQTTQLTDATQSLLIALQSFMGERENLADTAATAGLVVGGIIAMFVPVPGARVLSVRMLGGAMQGQAASVAVTGLSGAAYGVGSSALGATIAGEDFSSIDPYRSMAAGASQGLLYGTGFGISGNLAQSVKLGMASKLGFDTVTWGVAGGSATAVDTVTDPKWLASWEQNPAEATKTLLLSSGMAAGLGSASTLLLRPAALIAGKMVSQSIDLITAGGAKMQMGNAIQRSAINVARVIRGDKLAAVETIQLSAAAAKTLEIRLGKTLSGAITSAATASDAAIPALQMLYTLQSVGTKMSAATKKNLVQLLKSPGMFGAEGPRGPGQLVKWLKANGFAEANMANSALAAGNSLEAQTFRAISSRVPMQMQALKQADKALNAAGVQQATTSASNTPSGIISAAVNRTASTSAAVTWTKLPPFASIKAMAVGLIERSALMTESLPAKLSGIGKLLAKGETQKATVAYTKVLREMAELNQMQAVKGKSVSWFKFLRKDRLMATQSYKSLMTENGPYTQMVGVDVAKIEAQLVTQLNAMPQAQLQQLKQPLETMVHALRGQRYTVGNQLIHGLKDPFKALGIATKGLKPTRTMLNKGARIAVVGTAVIVIVPTVIMGGTYYAIYRWAKGAIGLGEDSGNGGGSGSGLGDLGNLGDLSSMVGGILSNGNAGDSPRGGLVGFVPAEGNSDPVLIAPEDLNIIADGNDSGLAVLEAAAIAQETAQQPAQSTADIPLQIGGTIEAETSFLEQLERQQR